MKQLLKVVLVLAALTLPSKSQAYFGAGIGEVGIGNGAEFGYGLVFGGGLFSGFGLDGQLIGFSASQGASDNYWIQGNIDLAFDVHSIISIDIGPVELHPYGKGGFTYAGSFFKGGVLTDTEASHGPGINFGAGLDVKLTSFLTVGLDLTEAFVFMDGVTVSGVALAPDETAKVFNILATVKLFAY